MSGLVGFRTRHNMWCNSAAPYNDPNECKSCDRLYSNYPGVNEDPDGSLKKYFPDVIPIPGTGPGTELETNKGN